MGNIDKHLDRIKEIQKELRMQTINQIKDCQAIDLGYNSFRDLVINPKKDQAMNHLNICIENSILEYARQITQCEVDVEKLAKDVIGNRKLSIDFKTGFIEGFNILIIKYKSQMKAINELKL